MVFRRSVRTFLGALLFMFGWGGIVPLPILAQYQVFSWENFESGVLPETLQMKHQSTPSTVGIFDYLSPQAPVGIRNGIAEVECGRFGLLFMPGPANKFLSLVSPVTLSRQHLGAHGKALYQADFYLPPPGEPIPTLAVLAVARDDSNQKNIWRMYRFGVYNSDYLFFAYADGDKVKGQPVFTRTQPIESMNLSRPGWHRFQIVFDGQDKIICAVDGQPTRFSPLIEPSLTELQAGIMVSSQADEVMMCFADNLSIQWTAEDLPLPESPWSGKAASTMFTSPAQPQANPHGGVTHGTQIHWHISPDSAWQQSQTEQRPLLVLFFTGTARMYPALEGILSSDAAAQQLVAQFVPLRIDVNQLMGGSLAQRFNVFRVPLFLVLGPDGTERARVVFDDNSTWASVGGQLQQALGVPR